MPLAKELNVEEARDNGGPAQPRNARPFLKWPGGKRWAALEISALVRTRLLGRYYEPFLGGGAVFFSLCPERATLSDVNGELIELYDTVRARPNEIIAQLKAMRVSQAEYYRIRMSKPRGRIQRAARFLYLNRTAFAGLYRLNSDGVFNVPFGGGRTPRPLWAAGLLTAASEALSKVKIRTCDFEVAMRSAREGDVVYCDPTYTVAHDSNGFRRYNERNFSWEDQRRLAECARRAASRGAVVLVSNAHHPSIRRLYADARARVLTRTSRVARDVDRRRLVREYLFIVEG